MTIGPFIGPAKYLEQSPCPVCGSQLTGIAATSDDILDPESILKDGDFSICLCCATILRFEFGYRLRKATNDDLKDLRDTEPEAFSRLGRAVIVAQMAIRDRQRKKRGSN